MTWILLGVAVGLASPFLILHRQRRRAAARVGLSVADAPEYVMPPRNDGALCGDDRFTEHVLAMCAPRLKVISKWGTGIDSIDQQAAARLGIRVCRTTNAFTLPVADTVLGYILTFARHLPWMDRDVKSGGWEKFLARSLSECTLGVVGVGNIGKAVLRRARVFGMKLLGNDIIEIAPDFLLENGVEMTSLENLLSRADFISLNCDLNRTRYHLMNGKTLSCLRPTAVLINTARGPIVDEAALIGALECRAPDRPQGQPLQV